MVVSRFSSSFGPATVLEAITILPTTAVSPTPIETHEPSASTDPQDSESGSPANAHAGVAQASLRELENLEVKPLTNEDEWHEQGPQGLQHLLATLQSLPSDHSTPTDPESVTSSMVMAISVQSSQFSRASLASHPCLSPVPSLTSAQTARSGSSAHTGDNASALEHRLLEEGSDGALREPDRFHLATDGFPCSFWFLLCSKCFDNMEDWDSHCQSHFHGVLPSSSSCPFTGCEWSFRSPSGGTTSISGRAAWTARIGHIQVEHQGVGVVDVGRRPDNSLIAHLWRNRAIDNIQMKELRKHGHLMVDHIYLRTERSDGRHRRREQRAAVRPAMIAV
jgi:hypothetical protein